MEQVFTGAVNLFIPRRNALYTLLGYGGDNAPHSCRLALERCDILFHPGERVLFHAQGIAVGNDKYIDFANCRPWQPEKISFSDARNWKTIAALINEEVKNSASLFYYRGDNVFYQEINRQLQNYRLILFQALRAEDIQAVENELIKFMGLGIGLTPTGDDYLAGMSIILFMPGNPACRFRDVFLAALEKGKQKTTLLSVITLREAINQRYREVIYRFVSALPGKETALLQQAIRDIQRIGSSSGSDMLCGMADALALSACYGGNDAYQDCD